ncbi:T9SS type A sorting domain-containing protein [Flavobacterium sp.]
MKKVLLFMMIVCANISFAQYTEWHVKPLGSGGSSSNLGTENSPWDLLTALSQPNTVVKPGDTVWLHGGTYTGHFTCSLQGSPTHFIKVASFPGEWAILNGNIYTFIPETVTPFAVCANLAQPMGDDETDIGAGDLDNDLNENLLDYPDPNPTDTSIKSVLRVAGSNIKFQDFEITCVGPVNKVKNPCLPNNGFHPISGIYHSPTATSDTKCIFANLYIHDLPGEGIGSWKFAEDSEIYGCSIFNNGYVLYNDGNCSSNSNVFLIFGKAPAIYTQNASSNKNRIIKNNFIMNNYDSGILVWSASSSPPSDYVRNYMITKNVIFNNGNPARRHDSNGSGTDSKPNMVIDSYSGNQYNHPSGIQVLENVFYLNSRGSWISGPRIGNTGAVGINGVDFLNNSVFKGTSGAAILGNNYNIKFKNNLYMGKRIQNFATPGYFSTHGYTFDANQYITRNSVTGMNMYQVPNPGSGPANYFITLGNFQSTYGSEPTSTVTACADGTVPVLVSSTMTQRSYVVQNAYNPNIFHVTIHNPLPNSVSNINVDFTSYNIPTGKDYRVKDAQNFDSYSSTPDLVGTLPATKLISFPMNLSVLDFPPHTEKFYDRCPEHSASDFATFIVEFGCKLMNYEEVSANVTETVTRTIEARRRITLGNNYVVNSTGVNVNAYAGVEIRVLADSYLKGDTNSNTLLRIENHCPNLEYVVEGGGRMSGNNDIKGEKEIVAIDNLIIYPNPSSGVFKAESKSDLKITDVIISDINSASTVFQKKYNPTNIVNIDISGENQGLYTLKVIFDDGSTSTNTIIKK